MWFLHIAQNLRKGKKWKTLIIFFEAIICQTDGLSSNSRVTEKIEELVNLVSFEHVQLKFSKLKRKLACLHTTLGSALKSSPFFSFFFLIQLPSYVSLLSGLKHWKPADEVFSSYPAATTVLKDYTAAAHWSNAKKILHKRPETKNGMDISASYEAIFIWMILFWLYYPTFLIFQNSE